MTTTTIIISAIILIVIQQIIAGIVYGFTEKPLQDVITWDERKKNLIDKWHRHPELKRQYTTIGWRLDPWNHEDGQTQHGNEYSRPIKRG